MADTWPTPSPFKDPMGKKNGMARIRQSVKKTRKKKGLTKKISNAEKELFKLIK